MKKGQSLSINVLIIAALAIIVLIVVAFMFFRGSGQTTGSLNSCEQQGGACVEKTDAGCGNEAPLPRDCDPENNVEQICCTKNLFGISN